MEDAAISTLSKVRADISVGTIAKVELQSAATSMVIVDVSKFEPEVEKLILIVYSYTELVKIVIVSPLITKPGPIELPSVFVTAVLVIGQFTVSMLVTNEDIVSGDEAAP